MRLLFSDEEVRECAKDYYAFISSNNKPIPFKNIEKMMRDCPNIIDDVMNDDGKYTEEIKLPRNQRDIIFEVYKFYFDKKANSNNKREELKSKLFAVLKQFEDYFDAKQLDNLKTDISDSVFNCLD